MSENFKKMLIGRAYVKVTEMEHMNIRKKTVKEKDITKKRTVTEEERQNHYTRRQQQKAEWVRALAELNFQNMQSVLVTLTFAEEPKTVDDGNRYIRNFIRCMRRRYNRLLYIAVLEFGEFGRMHYHLILNTFHTQQLESDIRESWKYGNEIDIQTIENVRAVAYYITKQFGREVDNALYGKKRYLLSNNLQKPEVLKSWEEDVLFEIVDAELKEEDVATAYKVTNDFAGEVNYLWYNKQVSLYDEFVMAVRIQI